ncbi:hypothetical protein NDU88_005958 [Pleurodeles waltl]|uniref:Uncharacterized protein n=1 Tax=Pleurodeles waltl TaxID=8319 RepID=A0AAV7X120_PLEWA|nr:hypothetical protein NDU88_005958 [Pleurodeles waltl]
MGAWPSCETWLTRAERAPRRTRLIRHRLWGQRTWEIPRVPRLGPRQSGGASGQRSVSLGRTAGDLGRSRVDRGLLGRAEQLVAALSGATRAVLVEATRMGAPTTGLLHESCCPGEGGEDPEVESGEHRAGPVPALDLAGPLRARRLAVEPVGAGEVVETSET